MYVRKIYDEEGEDVSILVLVDLARESLFCLYAKSKGKYVSILVLVDLAREFMNSGIHQEKDMGFNPCFSGSCS